MFSKKRFSGVFFVYYIRRSQTLIACSDKTMFESSNFNNPELSKFKSKNLLYACKVLIISSLNGQLSTEELKINQRSYLNLPNSVFLGWLSVESQPQNPEFRNNPENFHPYIPICKPTRASIGQRSYADRDNAPNREAGALNMKGVNKFRTCANMDTWLLEKAGTMVKRFNPWTHFVLVIKLA